MPLDYPPSAEALAAPAASCPRVLASGRIKARLMQRLRDMRQSRGLTQAEAAIWFGVSQPRVSHLAQNRVDRFTVDALINMLGHAGVRVSVIYQTDPSDARTPALRRRSRRDGR